MNIVVAGGGIGGLATAVGLQRRGFEVQVYEQAAEIRPVGAGVVLAPNSYRLLGEFGIDRGVDGQVPPGAIHLRRWRDGVTISRQVLGQACIERFGASYVALHRADLLDALVSHVRPGSLHLGRRIVAVVQDNDGVDVQFADGDAVRADLVVAADGIHSRVADAVGIATRPRASGYAAYRGMVPFAQVSDIGTDHAVWLGPDRHFVHYPVSDGKVLNFVAIVPSPRAEAESWSQPGELTDARRHFAGWDGRVRCILDAADAVSLWGLYDRPTRDTYHVGRVVVIGDAAHPVLPFFAQGASLALEDAAVLCAVLADLGESDITRRLAAFSAARVERVRRVQDVSHRNATMFHLPDGAQQQARDARLADASGGDPFRDNAWLFAHDVRADIRSDGRTVAQSAGDVR